jgi:hypothetical protein
MLQQSQKPLHFRSVAGSPFEGALDGDGKALTVKRLQQIIDGVHFKSAK